MPVAEVHAILGSPEYDSSAMEGEALDYIVHVHVRGPFHPLPWLGARGRVSGVLTFVEGKLATIDAQDHPLVPFTFCRWLRINDPRSDLYVSRMGEHDSVILEFTSRGCFHGHEYALRIDADQTELEYSGLVSLIEPEEDGEGTGPLTLSDSDGQVLDSILDEFRSGSTGSSTTMETLSVTWSQHGKVVHQETYRSSGGSSEAYSFFYSLVQRVPAGNTASEERDTEAE